MKTIWFNKFICRLTVSQIHGIQSPSYQFEIRKWFRYHTKSRSNLNCHNYHCIWNSHRYWHHKMWHDRLGHKIGNILSAAGTISGCRFIKIICLFLQHFEIDYNFSWIKTAIWLLKRIIPTGMDYPKKSSKPKSSHENENCMFIPDH